MGNIAHISQDLGHNETVLVRAKGTLSRTEIVTETVGDMKHGGMMAGPFFTGSGSTHSLSRQVKALCPIGKGELVVTNQRVIFFPKHGEPIMWMMTAIANVTFDRWAHRWLGFEAMGEGPVRFEGDSTKALFAIKQHASA